jgi:hypothetical protein
MGQMGMMSAKVEKLRARKGKGLMMSAKVDDISKG